MHVTVTLCDAKYVLVVSEIKNVNKTQDSARASALERSNVRSLSSQIDGFIFASRLTVSCQSGHKTQSAQGRDLAGDPVDTYVRDLCFEHPFL